MSPILSDNIIPSATAADNTLTDCITHATRMAGKGADPEKKALFASVTNEELAAFIAKRGVVLFRDQDDLDTKEHVKLGARWGPLHIHPLAPHGQEHPEVIVLDSRLSPPDRYNTNNSWHSDISCKPTPASLSSILTRFQRLVANTGRKTFGKLNDSEHPVIRTNPVTGWKSVFTDSVFTGEINGVSPTESKWILEHLNNLISKRLDYQVRFRWEKHSVATWDNRSTFHTGVPDFKPYFRRGLRVTVSGEKPYYDPNSGTQTKAWEATAKAITAKQEAAGSV
ncbi:hypothetical protein BGX34_012049 [Mortierella sp. NVP85]|nr:hypothetical protein BGX34_012049 [Mortierella sp. NVP85]